MPSTIILTNNQVGEDAISEAEGSSRTISPRSTPTKEKKKQRATENEKYWAEAALSALCYLKDNDYWVKATENLTPSEWMRETNELLKIREIKSLQELLLNLNIN